MTTTSTVRITRKSIAVYKGTAAVALAGIYASTRVSGIEFADLRIMFLGAGSAATGIADLALKAFIAAGLREQEATKRLTFVDVEGLLIASRDDLLEHNLPYACDEKPMNFVEAIDKIRPHILIGATGAPSTFTQEVVETMAKLNDCPAIFALSNPTSRAECTAEQAYTWSGGRAIFSSGSPFAPVTLEGKTYHPGQGNNAYIFPGIGLGAVACQATRISESMFLAAARTLAEQVSQAQLDVGSLYPPLAEIRDVSAKIAVAVAEQAYQENLAELPRPDDLLEFITSEMYQPVYPEREGED